MFDHREVSDVLDCPFCGSRPSLHPVGNDFTKSRKLTIKCTGCRVQMTNAAIRNDFDWLRKFTVEAWNKRTAMATLFEVLMQQNIVTSDESYLSLKCVGVPPSEAEFVSAVQRTIDAAIAASEPKKD